jgi:NitT/TauT family transport system substrate-binding protein
MRLVLLVAALLPWGALGCQRPAARPEVVTVEVALLPRFSLVHVAQARGYFRDEGLDVTLRPHRFGQAALTALLRGDADLATCAETPVVFAELRGERLSVLASIASATQNSAVIARREQGISGPADLRQRTIGVTFGTSGAFFLDTLLLRHGVDRRDVHLVDLTPETMADALARGEVDAVATWNPTAAELQKRFGAKVAAFHEEELHADTGLIVSRRGFAQQRPEAARRFVRALLRAETLFRSAPEEARRVATSALAVEPASLDAMLRLFEFRVRLDQGLLVLMEEEADWARRSGQVAASAMPDLLATMESAPLLAVKPEAVGFLR